MEWPTFMQTRVGSCNPQGLVVESVQNCVTTGHMFSDEGEYEGLCNFLVKILDFIFRRGICIVGAEWGSLFERRRKDR